MTFQLGQRVISLHSWSLRRVHGFACPQKHCIYTIRAFCPNADTPALLLQEILNQRIVRFAVTWRLGEPSFAASHFRPLFDISSLLELQKETEIENV